jgi:hypothetical protein
MATDAYSTLCQNQRRLLLTRAHMRESCVRDYCCDRGMR